MKSEIPDQELIVSSLLYLLTRYAQYGEKTTAKAICEHLEILHNHPETTDGCLFNTCQRLRLSWQRAMSSGAKSAVCDGAKSVPPDYSIH